MTRDPLGYADGPNVYCYVHCNPITKFDPLGLKTISDYEDLMEKRQERYEKQMERLESKWEDRKKTGAYNRERNRINQSYISTMNRYQKKIDSIEQTAARMDEFTGCNRKLDPRSLDDDDKDYKSFNRSYEYLERTGSRNFADHVVKGEGWKAVGSLAWMEAKGVVEYMVSAKALRFLKGTSQTRIGYHATYPEAAASIRNNGFRVGTKPGRLGSGGVYVNNTRAGAVAEFANGNPGVTPQVLKVRYQPGVNAMTDVAPRGYVDSIPLSVDSITAPSVRLPSSQNTIIFNPSSIEVLK